VTVPNPLLDMRGLPPFTAIRPEHVVPAVDQRLADGRATVAAVTAAGGTSWDTLVQPLEEMQHTLARTWSPVEHLNAVADEPALRQAHDACLPRLADFWTELGQNAELYRGYRALRDGPEYRTLDPVRQRIVNEALKDFHLAGVDLAPEARARFRAITAELATLGNRFAQNVLDATHGWHLHISDPERLEGLPETARALARQSAAQRGLEGWVLTLDAPSYVPVLTHARDRALREELYAAYVTRASDRGPHAGRWDNGPAIEAILRLRHELAAIVGFPSYAHFSLAKKMAGAPAQVVAFLTDLASRARPVAERELAELAAYARERDGLAVLAAWDVPFYAERLREARYAFSQEELRPYFPLGRVLEGLFGLAERLFGLRIARRDGVETWQPDVTFFEVRDEAGALRGEFYLDPYARPRKRGGAWMGACIGRARTRERLWHPVAYLVCNFAPPVGERPSLLTHQEVTTLFHEFGHGLHHLLTRVDYPSAAGINGVPWDAVELPSQIMENWCWESEALRLFARHHETGEALPGELVDRLRAARNFHSGLQFVRQLEFALFDFRLHLEYDPGQGARAMETLERVRDEVAVVRPPPYNRFPHSFSHVFAGGYAAGYYSYKWAEVLSADAFSRFEDEGVLSGPTGRAFLAAVLEQGGGRDPMELFIAFRGREPRIDALLRHSGLAPAA
jgi:oligopeptidase A